MRTKKLVPRALILALPLAVAMGCETLESVTGSGATSGGSPQTTAEANRKADQALAAVRDLRAEVAEANRNAKAAAEAAKQAAAAAQEAAAAAKVAADKADRIFQRQMKE